MLTRVAAAGFLGGRNAADAQNLIEAGARHARDADLRPLRGGRYGAKPLPLLPPLADG